MSFLSQVLNFINDESGVPDSLFQRLSPDERQALREFELGFRSSQHWKEITQGILAAAANLSRSKDKEDVLGDLVKSARSILHADVGYISLNNGEDHDTSVLVTSGVVTQQFKDIKIPLGVGVLGMVASRQGSAWTTDHASDPNVTHLPEVDAAVQAEGIRAILGAPLTRNGEIIGALMVGERRKRAYSPNEILVLESLASLASIALEKAELITSLEQSVEALRSAHQKSEEQVNELQSLTDVDAILTRLLNQGARPESIARFVSERLNTHTWIFNEAGELLVAFPDQSISSELEKVVSRAQNEESFVTEAGYSAIALSVHERSLGVLSVATTVDEAGSRIVHRASATLATALVFRETLAAAEARQVDDVLRKVVAGTASREDVNRLRKLTGFDVNDFEKSCIVSIETVDLDLRASTVNSVLAGTGIAFSHESHICALVHCAVNISQKSVESAMEPLLDWANARQGDLFIGAVPLARDLESISRQHEKSCALTRSLRQLSLTGRVAMPDSFGSLGLLLGASSESVADIVEATIGELLFYDESHSTELARTALAYLEKNRNVADTARELYVHENTVRQRLDRIKIILGSAWAAGTSALDVHLALRAWTLSNSTVNRENKREFH